VHDVDRVTVDFAFVAFEFEADAEVVEEIRDQAHDLFFGRAFAHLAEIDHREFFKMRAAVGFSAVAGADLKDFDRIGEDPVEAAEIIVKNGGEHRSEVHAACRFKDLVFAVFIDVNAHFQEIFFRNENGGFDLHETSRPQELRNVAFQFRQHVFTARGIDLADFFFSALDQERFEFFERRQIFRMRQIKAVFGRH